MPPRRSGGKIGHHVPGTTSDSWNLFTRNSSYVRRTFQSHAAQQLGKFDLREICLGDEVEFTMIQDPNSSFANTRQSAIRIKHLPEGTVQFETLIESNLEIISDNLVISDNPLWRQRASRFRWNATPENILGQQSPGVARITLSCPPKLFQSTLAGKFSLCLRTIRVSCLFNHIRGFDLFPRGYSILEKNVPICMIC
ncbi:hypothetical protein DMENIID0001_044780 [Sergentomyia squamirostris]